MMQEIKWTGEEKLTEKVTLDEIAKAVEDPSNKTVAIHKDGSEFVSEGQSYRVNGGKIEAIKRKNKRKAQRASRKKNRKKK
jgi:hypothetical protein